VYVMNQNNATMFTTIPRCSAYMQLQETHQYTLNRSQTGHQKLDCKNRQQHNYMHENLYDHSMCKL